MKLGAVRAVWQPAPNEGKRMHAETQAAMTETEILDRLHGLPALAAADPGLLRRGRFLDTEMLVGAGNGSVFLTIRSGRVTAVTAGPGMMRSWHFAVRGSVRAWDAYWQPVPEPGWHDLFALSKRGELRFEGDLHPLVANLQYVKDLLALPRRLAGQRG